MQHRHPRKSGLGCFLKILKNQQEQLKGMKTDICSSLLAKLFDGDTIPIMLTINNEYFQAAGPNDHGSFSTKYFRIESMDEEKKSVTLSLLKPFNICNDITPCFNELYRLVKTDARVTVCIDTISAIQCLDIDLMTKKVTIEPKW